MDSSLRDSPVDSSLRDSPVDRDSPVAISVPSLAVCSLTRPPPGWYFMLSVEPILERTFFRSGVGALRGRLVLGARGTGGFFSGTVCLGTGGLVMRLRGSLASPLVTGGVGGAAGVRGARGRVAEWTEREPESR